MHSSEIVGMKRNITDKGMISLFGRCIRSKESINSLTEVVFISSIPAIKIGSISLPSLTREKNSAAKPPLTFNDSVQSNRSIMRNAAVNFAEVFIRLFSVKSNAIRTKVVASSHRGGTSMMIFPPRRAAQILCGRRFEGWAAGQLQSAALNHTRLLEMFFQKLGTNQSTNQTAQHGDSNQNQNNPARGELIQRCGIVGP